MFAGRLIVWFQLLTSVRGFHLSVALYLLVLWALRSTLFAGTGGGDAGQLIFSSAGRSDTVSEIRRYLPG